MRLRSRRDEAGSYGSPPDLIFRHGFSMIGHTRLVAKKSRSTTEHAEARSASRLPPRAPRWICFLCRPSSGSRHCTFRQQFRSTLECSSLAAQPAGGRHLPDQARENVHGRSIFRPAGRCSVAQCVAGCGYGTRARDHATGGAPRAAIADPVLFRCLSRSGERRLRALTMNRALGFTAVVYSSCIGTFFLGYLI